MSGKYASKEEIKDVLSWPEIPYHVRRIIRIKHFCESNEPYDKTYPSARYVICAHCGVHVGYNVSLKAIQHLAKCPEFGNQVAFRSLMRKNPGLKEFNKDQSYFSKAQLKEEVAFRLKESGDQRVDENTQIPSRPEVDQDESTEEDFREFKHLKELLGPKEIPQQQLLKIKEQHFWETKPQGSDESESAPDNFVACQHCGFAVSRDFKRRQARHLLRCLDCQVGNYAFAANNPQFKDDLIKRAQGLEAESKWWGTTFHRPPDSELISDESSSDESEAESTEGLISRL